MPSKRAAQNQQLLKFKIYVALAAIALGFFWFGNPASWISRNEDEKVITVIVESNQSQITIEYLAWGPQSGTIRSHNRFDGEFDSPYVDEIVASIRETITVTIKGYAVDLDADEDHAEVTVKIYEDSDQKCIDGPHRTRRGQHTITAFCKHTSPFVQ